MADAQAPQSNEWWTAFPAPRAKCPEITADELMKLFDDMDIKPEPRQFQLVDVRRTDWEVNIALRTTLNTLKYQESRVKSYC
jgi:arsenical-resistance protein 2